MPHGQEMKPIHTDSALRFAKYAAVAVGLIVLFVAPALRLHGQGRLTLSSFVALLGTGLLLGILLLGLVYLVQRFLLSPFSGASSRSAPLGPARQEVWRERDRHLELPRDLPVDDPPAPRHARRRL